MMKLRPHRNSPTAQIPVALADRSQRVLCVQRERSTGAYDIPHFSPTYQDILERWRYRPVHLRMASFLAQLTRPEPSIAALEQELATNIKWLEAARPDFADQIAEILRLQHAWQNDGRYDRWLSVQGHYLRHTCGILASLQDLRPQHVLLAHDVCCVIALLRKACVFELTEAVFYLCMIEERPGPYTKALEHMHRALKYAAHLYGYCR